jgi:hypothetical protein
MMASRLNSLLPAGKSAARLRLNACTSGKRLSASSRICGAWDLPNATSCAFCSSFKMRSTLFAMRVRKSVL